MNSADARATGGASRRRTRDTDDRELNGAPPEDNTVVVTDANRPLSAECLSMTTSPSRGWGGRRRSGTRSGRGTVTPVERRSTGAVRTSPTGRRACRRSGQARDPRRAWRLRLRPGTWPRAMHRGGPRLSPKPTSRCGGSRTHDRVGAACRVGERCRRRYCLMVSVSTSVPAMKATPRITATPVRTKRPSCARS